MMAMSVIVDMPPRPSAAAAATQPAVAAVKAEAPAAATAATLFPCRSSRSSPSPELSPQPSTNSSLSLPSIEVLCSAAASERRGSRAPRCGRHGNWTPDEDAMLLRLVQRYNTTRTKRWTYVAKVLGTGRIGKQCRDRYLNHIGPGVVKTPWTPEEDELVIAAQQRLGNSWTRIAEFIGNGRPPNGIKNRWNSCLRFRQHAAAATATAAATASARARPVPAAPVPAAASQSVFQVIPPQNTPASTPAAAAASFGAARGARAMSVVLPPLTTLSSSANASPTQTQSSSSCSAAASPLLQPDAAAPLFVLPPLRARSTPVAASVPTLLSSPDPVGPVTLPALATLGPL